MKHIPITAMHALPTLSGSLIKIFNFGFAPAAFSAFFPRSILLALFKFASQLQRKTGVKERGYATDERRSATHLLTGVQFRTVMTRMLWVRLGPRIQTALV